MTTFQPADDLRSRSSPRDVFIHLLLILTLYMSVVSFIALLFQYIHVALPDPLITSSRAAFQGIRWSSSVLIVAFPVFLLLSWLLEKEFARTPQKRDLKIRKWLVYLTLFLAAVTIIVDLITLIYSFYGGELTARFALKTLVVLAVAATVFGYTLWDLRRSTKLTAIPRYGASLTGAVVVVTIVSGFIVGGSPATQRQLRFDEQRVSDLQTIQGQIVHMWTQKNALPLYLDDLADSISGFTVPRDPASEEPYEYRVKGDLSFELCAVFTTKGIADAGRSYPVRPAFEPGGSFGQNWSHDAGRVCFERTIDPALHQRPPD